VTPELTGSTIFHCDRGRLLTSLGRSSKERRTCYTHNGRPDMSRFNRTREKTEIARRLRRGSTEVEKLLWQRLRNGQIGGAQFRRQHPAGRYILDFWCPALFLNIELDGSQHAETQGPDENRDEWLRQQGVTILRFWNSDVIENIDGVLEVIAEKISQLSSATVPVRPAWRRNLSSEVKSGCHDNSPTPGQGDPHPAGCAVRPPPFRGR
jgi:very-short-patch-repair endonuclease